MNRKAAKAAAMTLVSAQEGELPQLRTAVTRALEALGCERRGLDSSDIDFAGELVTILSVTADLEVALDLALVDIRKAFAREETPSLCLVKGSEVAS